jgi:hypothetical protein
MKVELTIDLKAAKTLGLTISHSLLGSTDVAKLCSCERTKFSRGATGALI